MAQNPALTQLLTDLNAAPHPGMGNDFFAHVGSHLALARTVPPAWFPKTGTATEAQIGGLIANLHSLTTVAWGAYPLNGAANMTAWMIGSGHALLTAINQACAAHGFAPGSGTMCSEIQAKTMLNYTEVTKGLASGHWIKRCTQSSLDLTAVESTPFSAKWCPRLTASRQSLLQK